MSTETFYKKVISKNGRVTYVPVSVYDSEYSYSLPTGAHLIVNHNNTKVYKHRINPDIAPLIAAGIYSRDAMSAKLVEASEARPHTTPLTPEQREAWDTFSKIMGSSINYIVYPSAYDIIDAGVNELIKESQKYLSNPAVKEAYDHFMLLVKLSTIE